MESTSPNPYETPKSGALSHEELARIFGRTTQQIKTALFVWAAAALAAYQIVDHSHLHEWSNRVLGAAIILGTVPLGILYNSRNATKRLMKEASKERLN